MSQTFKRGEFAVSGMQNPIVKWLRWFVLIGVLALSFPLAAEENAPEEAPAPKPLSNRLTLKSEDGKNSITFGLTLQARFQFYSEEDVSAKDRKSTEDLSLARLRPSVGGSLLDPKFTYRLHVELAPGRMELLDFTVNYAFHPQAQLMGGVYKIPFTRYRMQSNSRLSTVDWSIAPRIFGAERQWGLMLHNGYGAAPQIEYEFGIFTGENNRRSHARGIWLVSGEKTDNPSSFTDPGKLDEFHPAFVGRIAYNGNGIDVRRETDTHKTGFRYSTALNMVWDPRASAYRDYTLRLAPEFLFKLYGWSLSGIYYLGFYKEDGKLSQTRLALHGAQIGTGYLLHEKVELAGLFAVAMTTAHFRDDTATRGATFIDTARRKAADPTSGVSSSDADAVAKQYGKAGEMKASYEATLALNVFLIGEVLVWQTDTSWLGDEKIGLARGDDWRVRTQFQLSF